MNKYLTVKDVIDRLKEFPEDMRVVLHNKDYPNYRSIFEIKFEEKCIDHQMKDCVALYTYDDNSPALEIDEEEKIRLKILRHNILRGE